jgi:hypothetical protein
MEDAMKKKNDVRRDGEKRARTETAPKLVKRTIKRLTVRTGIKAGGCPCSLLRD